MRTQRELEAFFCGLGIDGTEVEFYNQPAFKAAEQRNPRLLECYAELVQVRSYDAGYLARARHLVPKIAAYLRVELARGGREGACVPCSLALSKMLERFGIWNYVTAGSLTVEFDPHTCLGKRHWAHILASPQAVGHAWVAAPPFRVIDLTIGQQKDTERIKAHLPDMILSEESEPVAEVSLDDLIDQYLQRQILSIYGSLPTIHQVMDRKPEIANLMRTFQPFAVRTQSILAKYLPCCITALEEPFEEVRPNCFSGKSLPELWDDLVRQADAAPVI